MNSYHQSNELLRRARKTIPLGSQTFSKSYLSYPYGVSPSFVTHAKGSRIWDVDGNEYVDLVNALLPVVLGYGDEDVDRAITEQLEKGIIFSLGTELEVELSEALVEIIPCAEMVRFGKNGSDATAGAIRVARACTGREHVAVCGYHGWQDWYIGSTTRHKGVPELTRSLTHSFDYNDLSGLERLLESSLHKFAAVIIEPMNIAWPEEGFLGGVKQLAHKHGALFILDEIITGFRFHLGGAQALFDVEPDLATFGKGMGNGMPISAVVGKTEYMQEMENIFYSFTAGGEALSIAASLAVIRKMKNEPVVEKLSARGAYLAEQVALIIKQHGADAWLGLCGHPAWTLLQFHSGGQFDEWKVKTLFIQEMLKHGILIQGSHNISYALTPEDEDLILSAYREIVPLISNAIADNDLDNLILSQPLQSIFKVR